MSDKHQLDKADLEILAAIADSHLRFLKHKWEHLDKLYSERFYLEGQLAASLHKHGRISDSDLHKAWLDIDKRAGDHDDRSLNWFVLVDYLQNLARRLRMIARQSKEEARHAA